MAESIINSALLLCSQPSMTNIHFIIVLKFHQWEVMLTFGDIVASMTVSFQ